MLRQKLFITLSMMCIVTAMYYAHMGNGSMSFLSLLIAIACLAMGT